MSEFVPSVPARADDAVPRSSTTLASARQGLEAYEVFVLEQLAGLGLPTTDILVDVAERARLMTNVDGALERLPQPQRATSVYLSKMLAAASVGLFDAALNYLWDETVSELRRRVTGYDLAYFFDLAARSPDRRRHLKTEDDLHRVEDVDLMRAAREMGLISESGYAQLELIRYMRNYASAAHPNQNELTGLQLAGWLETCIREVITLPLDHTVAEIRKLLSNIKAMPMDQAAIATTAAFFGGLGTDQADSLAAGLFGIYIDLNNPPPSPDNVRALWPKLWPYVSENARHGFGGKYGRFHANADQVQAARARELLDLVDAAAYFPEPVRQTEIDRALDDLLEAHHGWSNFHTEPAPARALLDLVGDHGQVPAGLQAKYVLTLVEVFLTNGTGIAWAADPLYREMIGRFDVAQASAALRAFSSRAIASRLQSPLAAQQWRELEQLLEVKLTGRPDRELLAALRAFSGPLDQLRNDGQIRRLLSAAASS